MKSWIGICVGLIVCGNACAADVVPIAPGVDLIPGAFVPNGQPDGNSVIFRAPEGLVVMDTGRHVEHTQKILDYAKTVGLPIQAPWSTRIGISTTSVATRACVRSIPPCRSTRAVRSRKR